MLPLVFSVVLSIPIIHVEILSSGPRVAFEWPSSGHGVALERSVRLIPNRNRSVVDPSIKIERYSRATTDYFNMDDRNRQYEIANLVPHTNLTPTTNNSFRMQPPLHWWGRM